MATVRFVVNSALRKIGRLGAGREPRVADQTDVLAALQGLYGSWIAAGSLGRVSDVVPQGSTYTARGNERIIRMASELSVELPELVSDSYVSDYGRGRTGYYGTVITITDQPNGDTTIDVQASQPIGWVEPPRDGSVVVITDREGGQTAAWIYEGTIKVWQRIDALQLDDDAPRSVADPEGLSALLAMEIADTFGAEVGATTQRQAVRYQVALTQRFGMRREPVPGVYC